MYDSSLAGRMSASKAGLFLDCPLKYKYQYVDNAVGFQGNIYTAYGSSIHAALAFNFKQKITTRKDLPEEKVIEFFKSDFKKGVDSLQKIDFSVSEMQTMLLSGENCLFNYMKVVAPTLQPAFVEEKMEITLKNFPITLVFIWDMVTEDDIIIDFKTVGKAWKVQYSESKINNNLQSILYSAGFRKKFGKVEKRFEFHVLPRGESKAYILPVINTEEKIIDSLKLLSSITAILKTGLFVPNLSNCSGCDFKSTCKKLPIQL